MIDCVRHNKVYDSDILLSDPPKRNWICSICGDRGTDIIGGYIGHNEYSDLVQKFSNAAD